MARRSHGVVKLSAAVSGFSDEATAEAVLRLILSALPDPDIELVIDHRIDDYVERPASARDAQAYVSEKLEGENANRP